MMIDLEETLCPASMGGLAKLYHERMEQLDFARGLLIEKILHEAGKRRRIFVREDREDFAVLYKDGDSFIDLTESAACMIDSGMLVPGEYVEDGMKEYLPRAFSKP